MNRVFPAFILILGLASFGCTDVVSPLIEFTGPPTINAQGHIEVPLRAIVANQGTTDVPIFKQAVYFENASIGPYVVSYNVPGQTNIWYPFTSGVMVSGDQEEFNGTLTFLSFYSGETVDVYLEADSCSGDEFMPPYCRVDETNEGNNLSPPLSLTLP